MSSRTVIMMVLLLAAGAIGALAQARRGPGDPTTVFATGFEEACRLAFDSDGNLFVGDVPAAKIYKITPSGTRTLATDQVSNIRGISFDAFGNLLIPSADDTAVHKLSPQGELTEFLSVVRAARVRTGPDGSLWVTSIDTLHHFDALGRPLERIDLVDFGVGAHAIMFSPSGELYMSNWTALWKLVNGTPVAVMTEMQPQMWSPAFDELGNIYWPHIAVEQGDVGRVILYASSGEVLEDTLVSQAQSACVAVFGRDADGTTNQRLFLGQNDGTILEVNSAGVLAPGSPVVGLSLDAIAGDDCASEVVGIAGRLSGNEARFLDVIGNNNGSYDVGDFRAYLIATGVVEDPGTAAAAR